MTIKLIPVLELHFPPHAYEKAPDTPEDPYWEYPQEWDEYNRQLMAASGYQTYTPIAPGSSFYRVSQFTNLDDVKAMIDIHLTTEEGEQVPVAQSCSFFGGLVLMIDGKPKLFPQCCGVISDAVGWEELTDVFFEEGNLRSEAHPAARFKRVKNEMRINCRGEEPFEPPTDKQMVLDYDQLCTAIAEAKAEVEAFAAVVNQLSSTYEVERLADNLVWGD